MQDPRLRLFSVIVISITAFSSLTGASLAFLWWLFCTNGLGLLRRSSWPLLAFIPLLLVTIALWITAGDWISYLVRLGVVLLIAIFAYQDQRPGEFMKVCSWAFGPVRGFDLGLAGEMALGSLRFLEGEIERVRQAFFVKGIPFGIQSVIPVSAGLVFGLLRRSEDQADLLLTRGYVRGGMACPRFSQSRSDIFVSGIAIFFFILGFLPVREFFILIQ